VTALVVAACLVSARVCTVQTEGGTQDAVTPRALALTFDDLPYVDVLSDEGDALSQAREGTAALLQTLVSRGAPAVAFVNEGKLGSGSVREARTALLQQWVDAGAVLGNHTYSHADLNSLTAGQFEEEILRGEVVTRRLMRSREPYQLYFRYPQTHTGDTRVKKEAIEAFLAERGYRIAPHTIDSEDFVFNAGFVRARIDHDEVTLTRLRDAYLDFVMRATDFAESVSLQIFHRQIPQTVLLHANAINADALAALLRRFEERGYRFVTLDSVMEDPAYRTSDTFVTRAGPTWLWRWRQSLGLSVSFRGDPEPADWVWDLFNRSRR